MGFIRNVVHKFDELGKKSINDNFMALWKKTFGGIDSEDISKDADLTKYVKSLTADMIKSGTIDANLINVVNLIVGDNVQMGPNATISWSQVDGGPDMGSFVTMTQIGQDYIITGKISVEQLSTPAGIPPIIRLFMQPDGSHCSIDATENNEQGVGNMVRLKWDKSNYTSVGEPGFYAYNAGTNMFSALPNGQGVWYEGTRIDAATAVIY
jgi:hypothetical protein